MNIEIQVSKSNMDYDPKIFIKCSGETKVETIYKLKQTICFDVSHKCDTKLVISRKQEDLYNTGYNYHVNKITIDKIILDDFWELTKDFYTPKSICDEEYIEHFVKVNQGDWLDDALVYNTTLFFNGSLEWDIMYPIRRSFYKDINR